MSLKKNPNNKTQDVAQQHMLLASKRSWGTPLSPINQNSRNSQNSGTCRSSQKLQDIKGTVMGLPAVCSPFLDGSPELYQWESS